MFEQRHSTNEQKGNKSGIQCYHCKKFGNVKANCWYKEKQVNFAGTNDEKSKLFMTHYDTNYETQKISIKLGDNKDIQVVRKRYGCNQNQQW